MQERYEAISAPYRLRIEKSVFLLLLQLTAPAKHKIIYTGQNMRQDTRHKTQDTRHKTQDTRHKNFAAEFHSVKYLIAIFPQFLSQFPVSREKVRKAVGESMKLMKQSFIHFMFDKKCGSAARYWS